jgi:hypothetical protein
MLPASLSFQVTETFILFKIGQYNLDVGKHRSLARKPSMSEAAGSSTLISMRTELFLKGILITSHIFHIAGAFILFKIGLFS